MIQRLIFPLPSTTLDEKTAKQLVYIPSFKGSASYKIMGQYFKANVNDTSKVSSPGAKYFSLNTLTDKKTTPIGKSVDETQQGKETARKQYALMSKMNMASIDDMNPYARSKVDSVKGITNKMSIVEKTEQFLAEPDDTYDFEMPKRDPVSSLLRLNTLETVRGTSRPDLGVHNKGEQTANVVDIKILKQLLEHYIPCLYVPYKKCDTYLLYFHSNAEDVTQLADLCQFLAQELHINVLAMEYAGYSVYKHSSPSADRICNDAESLVNFLRETCSVPLANIIVMGRSIGSGPASHLCSAYKFGMLVLISPFLSIKEVVKDRSSFASRFVDAHFDNEVKLETNKTPLLLLHGKNDGMIGPWHSERLYSKTKSKAKLIVFNDMAHNDFSFFQCVVEPVLRFADKVGFGKNSDAKKNAGLNKRIERVFAEKVL